MTKREREKIEREKLKNMLADNPKLKEIIDNMIENPNPEAIDAIKPVIEERLSEQRMIGIKIGFQAATLEASNEAQKVNTLEELNKLKVKWQEKADKIKESLGLQYGSIDEVGEII